MSSKRSLPQLRPKLKNLSSHEQPYLTTGELADYWLVSRRQVFKHIEAGTLHAIRLGPRLLRISTREALDFEQRLKMAPASLLAGEKKPRPQVG